MELTMEGLIACDTSTPRFGRRDGIKRKVESTPAFKWVLVMTLEVGNLLVSMLGMLPGSPRLVGGT